METINISATISNNRNPISMIGSNLGKQFFTVEARDCWPDFEKEKASVGMAGNVQIILNRSPRRFKINAKDIVGIIVDSDINGDPVLKINPKRDGLADVILPITNEMVDYGVVTEEAVKEALKAPYGEAPTKVFCDPKKLMQFLNQINEKEIGYIKALRDKLSKMEQGIQSAIADNVKKANDYYEQVTKKNMSSTGTTSVEVNIHQ